MELGWHICPITKYVWMFVASLNISRGRNRRPKIHSIQKMDFLFLGEEGQTKSPAHYTTSSIERCLKKVQLFIDLCVGKTKRYCSWCSDKGCSRTKGRIGVHNPSEGTLVHAWRSSPRQGGKKEMSDALMASFFYLSVWPNSRKIAECMNTTTWVKL